MKTNTITIMIRATLILIAVSALSLLLFLLLVKSPVQIIADVTVRAPSTTRYYTLEVELPLSDKHRLKGLTNCLLLLPRDGAPEWRLPARIELFQPLPHALRLRLVPQQNDDETRLYLADLADGTLRTRLIAGQESLWSKILRQPDPSTNH